MFKKIKKVYSILDSDQRKKFKFLMFLMVIAMIVETLSIGSLFPLITFLTNSENILFDKFNLDSLFSNGNISEDQILALTITIIVIMFLLKNVFITIYSWIECRFAYKIRFDTGIKLFKKYLNSSYLFHIENNSSVLTTKVVHQTAIFGSAVLFTSSLITEILVSLGIISLLFFLKPIPMIVVLGISLTLGAAFYLPSKNLSTNAGKRRDSALKNHMKSLQQGLAGIKDIIIFGAEKYFVNDFKNRSDDAADPSAKIIFLSKLPKIWIETSLVVIICFSVFYLKSADVNSDEILSTLGIFLIALLRVLPSINKILIFLQNIRAAEAACDGLIKDLRMFDNDQQKHENVNKKIIFENNIIFNKVNFKYPNSKDPSLKNIDLEIKKNQFIGIVGKTGSGKSTLVNLLIGLTNPSSGKILSDGKEITKNIFGWRKLIGLVPQNLFMLDSSIAKNIAFGIPAEKISHSKISEVLLKSELDSFVKQLNNGYDTSVGEKGEKISGGEKQRLGIARSLYNDPEIIVLDEGTNSLDSKTESKIIENFLQLKGKKTIIFVTHKISNLKNFDKIFEVVDGKVIEKEVY